MVPGLLMVQEDCGMSAITSASRQQDRRRRPMDNKRISGPSESKQTFWKLYTNILFYLIGQESLEMWTVAGHTAAANKLGVL